MILLKFHFYFCLVLIYWLTIELLLIQNWYCYYCWQTRSSSIDPIPQGSDLVLFSTCTYEFETFSRRKPTFVWKPFWKVDFIDQTLNIHSRCLFLLFYKDCKCKTFSILKNNRLKICLSNWNYMPNRAAKVNMNWTSCIEME